MLAVAQLFWHRNFPSQIQNISHEEEIAEPTFNTQIHDS